MNGFFAIALIAVTWYLLAMYYKHVLSTEFFVHRDDFDPDELDEQESCETIGTFPVKPDTTTPLQQISSVVVGSASGMCLLATMLGACASAVYMVMVFAK